MPDVISVSSRSNSFAVIRADGSLWMWGTNRDGEIGIGDLEMEIIEQPVKVMENVRSVSAQVRFTSAITKDNELYSWGLNDFGQLGLGAGYKTRDFDTTIGELLD